MMNSRHLVGKKKKEREETTHLLSSNSNRSSSNSSSQLCRIKNDFYLVIRTSDVSFLRIKVFDKVMNNKHNLITFLGCSSGWCDAS